MDHAYDDALRIIADSYEAEAAERKGKSLARIGTIVVNNGAFFQRLREGKPFLVHNLERFAEWFRQPENWPWSSIPQPAASALASMGRPPLAIGERRTYRTDAAAVRSNDARNLDQSARA